MYSPPLGRFLSRDPLPLNGEPDILTDGDWFGDRLTMMKNLYGYVHNNPLRFVDPSGMYAWCSGVSGDVGGFVIHPSLNVKICWDDCGNLAVAATRVSAPPALFGKAGKEGVPGAISIGAGMSLKLTAEINLRRDSCVKSMSGIFFELHVYGGEGIVGEAGIEVTPGINDVVVQVGVGIGGGTPIGAIVQRTQTFMAKCTTKKCPCCHPWYDVRQYLKLPAMGQAYLPEAMANCALKLGKQLRNFARGAAAGRGGTASGGAPGAISEEQIRREETIRMLRGDTYQVF